MTELTVGRDFGVYASQMDASLKQKLEDIGPWIKGERIVDMGCGTGTLLTVLHEMLDRAVLVGVDASPILLAEAARNLEGTSVHLIAGDLTENTDPRQLGIIPRRLWDIMFNQADTMIFSSVLHEVYSYSGYSHKMVEAVLQQANRSLKPGGRLIIRDGVSPGRQPIWMRLPTHASLNPAVNLTERFWRFFTDFKAIDQRELLADRWNNVDPAHWYFNLTAHLANEYLSKKDYLINWDQEMHEEFGIYTWSDWINVLDRCGFDVVHSHQYVNPWIRENRYEGQVSLYADEDGAPGEPIDYPATNVVLVGEKRP